MKYHPKLDGLRFVAICFVLIEHFAHGVAEKFSAGYYGVDLFFVISGFLITSILLKSKGSFFSSYKNFVGRRTLRIFPIYYLTIFIMLVAGYQPVRDTALSLITYTFNYAWIYDNLPLSSVTHFWSLAVEEQFYLFWPFFILSLRHKPAVLMGITLGVIALCYTQLSCDVFGSVTPYNYVGLFPRAGSLCVGSMGGILFTLGHLPHEVLKDRVVEYLVVLGLLATLMTQYPIKTLVLAICSLYFVLKTVHSDFNTGVLNRLLMNKWLMYVGTISYGIYIFHMPIGYFFTYELLMPWMMSIQFTHNNLFMWVREYHWVVTLPVFSLLAIMVAHVSHKFVEKPILTLKDKYFRNR